jgi:hypothetical protein
MKGLYTGLGMLKTQFKRLGGYIMKSLHYGNMIVEFTEIKKSDVYRSLVYSIFNGSYQVASIVVDELLKFKKLKGFNLWYIKNVDVK